MRLYRFNETGIAAFRANKPLYLRPEVRGKLACILSSGIPYSLDSLTAQAQADERIGPVPEGKVLRALLEFETNGFLEVRDL